MIWPIASRGRTYQLMGQYDAALADFDRAIELDPDDASAIVYRGIFYRDMGRFEKTLADFDAALEMDVDQGWVYANRGVAYRLMERYEDTLADLDRAIELRPDMVWPFAVRGVVYRSMGRYEQALTDLNMAVEWDPKPPWASEHRYLYDRALTWKLLGRMNKAQTDLAAAIQCAKEVRRGKPQAWRTILRLALCYLASEDAEETNHLYQEALSSRISPRNIRGAIQDIDVLLDFFPDHPQAREMRDLLQDHLEEANT